MKIGIDISQTVYGTGVGNFVLHLVEKLTEVDSENDYILFGSSLRQRGMLIALRNTYKGKKHVSFKIYPFPPAFLDLVWNRVHVFPIENFIGDVDVFISSDWTQPPVKQARNVTVIYDMIVYKHPNETAKHIIDVQTRKWKWVKKEIDMVICISEATKKDAMAILGLPGEKFRVVYPGV